MAMAEESSPSEDSSPTTSVTLVHGSTVQILSPHLPGVFTAHPFGSEAVLTQEYNISGHLSAEESMDMGVGVMGSFQQLLQAATTGVLGYDSSASFTLDDQSAVIVPPEEGYDAEDEPDECEELNDAASFDVAQDSLLDDSILNSNTSHYAVLHDFITSFTDNISAEAFGGRDALLDCTETDPFCVAGETDGDCPAEAPDPQTAETTADVVSIDSDSDSEDETEKTPGPQTAETTNSQVSANVEGDGGNGNAADAITHDPATCLLGDCGCVSQDLVQEIYPIFQQGLDHPYRKRKRTPKNAVRPDCRKPRVMGAVEIAMRRASQRETEHIFEPILGMVFDSREEAFEYYNMYSWEVGFGVKFNRRRFNDNKSYRTMQEIVCKKGGSDRRITKGTKRTKCPARITMLRTEDGGFYINKIVKEHNHPMAESCGEKREWPSHRKLDQCTIDMIRYLRENDVSLTKVHCIMTSMFGNMDDVPWTKRSIRTICNQLAREQMSHDVNKTVEIFKEMRENDPGFQWSVELDEISRIKTLIWCTGKGRDQYAYFGDAITFDTTYCTNIYKMPFGLFVGVNNHFQSIIFGGVLMRNETTDSFKWVFTEFLKLMGGKHPQTILTDQCKSMTAALAIVMPGTFHLWCKWHVMKSIRESLGPLFTKNAEFREDFYAVANEMLSKEEFEAAWNALCKKYDIGDNPFMIRTYECREKWAKGWAKGNYCAGMTSTQRSESANMMLKRFVPRNSSMNHFVSQFMRLLQDRDKEEDRQEDQTKQFEMKHDRLWPVERHAMKIYTKASFMLFRKEVNKAADFVVSGKGQGFYLIRHQNPAKRPTWARDSFKVDVIDDGERYCCECGFYEHIGILCCHILRLFIRLDVSEIPAAHIKKRWTRDARDVLPEHLKLYQKDIGIVESLTFRHTIMYRQALEAVKKGDIDKETFEIVMKHMRAAVIEVDELLKQRAEKILAGEDVQRNFSPSEYEDDYVGVQSDIEPMQGNRYGASGSCAGMSDTEILNMKAPLVNRPRGRPRVTRYRASSEKRTKRSKKVTIASTVLKRKKSVAKKGSKGVEAPSTPGAVRKNYGAPKQSKFCSKCKTTGHNVTTCGIQETVKQKKPTQK